MYASRIDLPADLRDASTALLQARLSEALDLEAQLKQAHWNVKGRDFYPLHQLFDAIHGGIEGFADTIAERIATLGGVADGRVGTTASATGLPTYPLEASAGEEHLRAVAAGLAAFGRAVRTNIDDVGRLGDADTADVFTEISRETDRQLWFVEAHLQG